MLIDLIAVIKTNEIYEKDKDGLHTIEVAFENLTEAGQASILLCLYDKLNEKQKCFVLSEITNSL